MINLVFISQQWAIWKFRQTAQGAVEKYRQNTRVGWSKNPVSSQTDKLMAGTKFSDYLGTKYYKKAKKQKIKKKNQPFNVD